MTHVLPGTQHATCLAVSEELGRVAVAVAVTETGGEEGVGRVDERQQQRAEEARGGGGEKEEEAGLQGAETRKNSITVWDLLVFNWSGCRLELHATHKRW